MTRPLDAGQRNERRDHVDHKVQRINDLCLVRVNGNIDTSLKMLRLQIGRYGTMRLLKTRRLFPSVESRRKVKRRLSIIKIKKWNNGEWKKT